MTEARPRPTRARAAKPATPRKPPARRARSKPAPTQAAAAREAPQQSGSTRRIWISGATGFVGKAVARVLRARGDSVIAPVRDPRKATELRDMGVTVLEDDLSDVASLTEMLRDVDAAIHAAGSYRIGITREERGAMWDANIGATTRVLDAVEAAKTPKLVYVSTDGHRLLVIDATGGKRRRLLSGPAGAFEAPAGWSPNGKKILFTRSFLQNGEKGSVFVVNADGTHVRRLSGGFAGSWSPDGRKILYTRSFSRGLFVMNADGSHGRQVLGGEASEPNWR
jgi:hypothetical protein